MSAPSTASRAPSKRWYLASPETAIPLGLIIALFFAAWVIVAATAFIAWATSAAGVLARALAVLAVLGLVWCGAFLRRGWLPPESAHVFGEDRSS